MRSGGARGLLRALVIVLAVAGPYPALAQVNMQLSGTVESIEGPVLTLRTPPPPARRVTLGTNPTPAPAQPPTLVVDLEGAPASQWVFLRPGDRIAVVGLLSPDGRRFSAVAVIGGSGPSRGPEAP